MATSAYQIAGGNGLLRRLAGEDWMRIAPYLERMPLPYRARLETQHRRIEHVYFIERGIASVVAIGRRDRRQAEVGLVGAEGMTGVSVVQGVDRSPYDVVMQVAGVGLRIAADRLREIMELSQGVAELLRAYVHVFSIQCSHTALANAQGKIEERLARWLLMTRDRQETDELQLTHEFISHMLGVRRGGVTIALQEFAAKGLIATSRGSVAILDRGGLEACANGFYGAPEAEYERLFAPAGHLVRRLQSEPAPATAVPAGRQF